MTLNISGANANSSPAHARGLTHPNRIAPSALGMDLNQPESALKSFGDVSLECYNKSGHTYPLNPISTAVISAMDNGTAAHTTVHINRAAFDEISYATTFGETKWEELGVDDEKRWIVIDGQRFECEHSPQEKALRKKLAALNLADVLNNLEKMKKNTPKGQDNGVDKPRGNVEALIDNKGVMKLLGKLFNANSEEAILFALH